MPCPECHEQLVMEHLKGWCPVCGQQFLWLNDVWYPVDETAEPERGGYSWSEQE